MLTNIIYLLIHFATTGIYGYIKQHENNNKNQSKIKRERERMLSCAASNYLIEFVIPWQKYIVPNMSNDI